MGPSETVVRGLAIFGLMNYLLDWLVTEWRADSLEQNFGVTKPNGTGMWALSMYGIAGTVICLQMLIKPKLVRNEVFLHALMGFSCSFGLFSYRHYLGGAWMIFSPYWAGYGLYFLISALLMGNHKDK